MAGLRWTHGTLAGFPPGIPKNGVEMEIAIQQAPHLVRHCISDASRALKDDTGRYLSLGLALRAQRLEHYNQTRQQQ